MKKLILFFSMIVLSKSAFSEDIELYIGDAAARTGTRPQVLIIFDNSGSMNTTELVTQPYDPNTVYPAIGGLNSLSSKFIYFKKGTGADGTTSLAPDSPSETRRFLDGINSCATARERLATVGFYTGHIREYSYKSNSGSWQEIPDNNGANIEVIDCEDDVKLVPANPEVNAGYVKSKGASVALPDGFPIDGQGDKQTPIYYTANATNSNVIWSGEVVTLYTDNYLRWSNSTAIAQVNRTRLDIAKDTVTDLVESAPSIDFGLQIFNHNHSGENTRDGGRIVMGIQEMTATARTNLVNIIDLNVDGETWTPLCETLYEASLYFGGKAVKYGNDDSNHNQGHSPNYQANTPPRDTSIEQSGTYKSPFTNCSNEVFVIMITDGEPTYDKAADTLIAALPGIGSPLNVNGTDNYLAALAGWMHTHDLNTNANMPEDQTARLFTIGFGNDAINDAEPLLKEAALQGGGKYYPAKDPSSLLASLQSAISTILAVNTSFTAPSVASNNFDRTETLDSVYYAMFVPDRGASWQGNLKKLKVKDGVQVDRNDAPAIAADGTISKDAKTFWSTSVVADGNDVKKGGVAEMLATKTSRKVLSDLNGGLVTFDLNSVTTHFTDVAGVATELSVLEADVPHYINWALGIDVDDIDQDGSKLDIRPDVFGDPLHSKPLVINYGGSATNQDVRIIVGTNAGALHMFKDLGATVEESWAFMPKEFFPSIKTLKDNFSSSGKVYGIDGPATSYLYDENGDGSISGTKDKAWIFFGLRRGGSSYYGMDVTDQDNPKLMWHIDENTSGFSELGQSWSQPRVGYSKKNVVNGVPKPVLIFGAGYSVNKDSAGVGSDDTVGRGIYMLDAEKGTLLWSLTPAATSSTNTQFTGFTDSIPSRIAVLDSDSDGLIDRLYVGDTGGNLWRVDMPDADPFSSTLPWTVFKLAGLGSAVDNANDRRFFNAPSIVRTFITDTIETSTTVNGVTTKTVTKQERPYEAILIGSGDRSTPKSIDTDDRFFMVKDEKIITQSYKSGATAPAPVIPIALGIDDLYNYTDNPFGKYVAPLSSSDKAALEQLEINVGKKHGWYVEFDKTKGEKSLASALAINGVAYFTSFTPAAVSAGVGSCLLSDGSGLLYAVDLAFGTTVHNWREWLISEGIPDTPAIIITKDKDPNPPTQPPTNPPPGEDLATIKLLAGKIIPLNISLKTSRSYLYVDENQ